jgi:hypothetical protein
MMLLALALAAAAPASGADTPRGFIERLYASYRHADYSPFKHPERVFAPRLLAAINEDSRLAKGEVGYLDGDPVCQCQDAAGMHASIVGSNPLSRKQANVIASIRFGKDPPRWIRFSLARTKAGWRIADVSSADEASLLAALEKANRKARGRH